jgi:hypothetical protein
MNLRPFAAGGLLWLAVLLAPAASSAQAASVDDYASQWPVLGRCDAPGAAAPARDGRLPPPLACEGAFAIALDEAVYRQASDAALADVAAFDAAGEPLAFGPMPREYRKPPEEWRDVAWFALPGIEVPAAQDLHLHVTRTAAGELRFDADLRHGQARDVRDLLVDVRAKTRRIEALEFELAMDAPDFSSALAVEASEDLQHWRTIVPAAAIAQLRQSGRTLVRRRIEFPPFATRYLRLRVVDGGAAVPLRGLRMLLHPEGPPSEDLARAVLRAEPAGQDGRVYRFTMPARIPADRIAIRLADDNAVASFAVSAREAGRRDWSYVGQFDAFRLRGGGLRLDNEAFDIAPTRAREWRIETSVELARAPVLEFSYLPEEWLLLTHGPSPYRVVAGSHGARRAELPLGMLVGEVRRRYGATWRPPLATLGPMAEAGGASALRAWDPARRRTLLLWGVLALGALAVIAMVLRLLRPRDP